LKGILAITCEIGVGQTRECGCVGWGTGTISLFSGHSLKRITASKKRPAVTPHTFNATVHV